MHRKENCSIPRLDLLDQSRSYIQHTEKLKKMKPSINTSYIEPVHHFSVAHKEKEKEWEYADSISKMCYSQIQASKSSKGNFKKKRSISSLSTSRKNSCIYSKDYYPNISQINQSQRPQFNIRTNIYPSSPKGGIYNYPASFDSTSLSASGMMSQNFSSKPLIDEDGSILTDSPSIFLTQEKKMDCSKYQYAHLDDPKVKQKIEDDKFEVSVKKGMKFVEFSCEPKNKNANSKDGIASRLNSRFRKSFYLGSTDIVNGPIYEKDAHETKNKQKPELYSIQCDAKFNFTSSPKRNIDKNKTVASRKVNAKSRKHQLINNFENTYKYETKKKRSVKLKIFPSLFYESVLPNEQISITWVDQKDLLSQDELDNYENGIHNGFIKGHETPIDKFESNASSSTQTAVDFTFYDDDEIKPIHLAQSPLDVFETFELELSISQHVLDLPLNDTYQSENDEFENKNASEKEIPEYSKSQNGSNLNEVKNDHNEPLPTALIKANEEINDNNPNYEYSYYSDYEEI